MIFIGCCALLFRKYMYPTQRTIIINIENRSFTIERTHNTIPKFDKKKISNMDCACYRLIMNFPLFLFRDYLSLSSSLGAVLLLLNSIVLYCLKTAANMKT